LEKRALIRHKRQTQNNNGDKNIKKETHQQMRQQTWTFHDIIHVLRNTTKKRKQTVKPSSNSPQ